MLTGLLLLIPILFSLLIIFINDIKTSKVIALAGSLSEWILSLVGLYIYLTQCHCLLLLNLPLIERLGISLRFGMDGISLLLVLLTTFLYPVIILNAWDHDYIRPPAFYGWILLLEMAFIGVFTAFNGMVFYIFWEFALILAYFVYSGRDSKDRSRITFRFFIYTFTGSLFLLATLIFLYFHTPLPHSFDPEYLYSVNLTGTTRIWVFLGFFLAFAIRVSNVFYHSRRPATLTSSSQAGIMILGGIVVMVGIYGLIRFLIPVF